MSTQPLTRSPRGSASGVSHALAALLLAACVAPATQEPEAQRIVDLDAQDPYRTPRAGEGIRGEVFGERIEEPPRDRRSVLAWDVGIATTPRVDGAPVLPFASVYYWDNVERDHLVRAVSAAAYNEMFFGKRPAGWDTGEVVVTFESFTVPVATQWFVDGENLEQTEAYWGYLRPGFGLGIRDRVGPAQDNMFELNGTLEPGLLYFARGDETGADYRIPSTTLELRARARMRLDMLERNLLELPHSGYAVGADLVYGYRTEWDEWGDPALAPVDAGAERDYLLFTGYALGVAGVPFAGDRHRLVGSVHGGIGDDIDRWSAPRIGGGPDPRGEEYGSVWRPILYGSAIGEFVPEHYVIGYAGYRFEPIFFAYLDLFGSAAWLDRERLDGNTVRREDDVLRALGVRLTSGFLGRTRVQMHYAYNFDVVREGSEGGFEITLHVSGQF